MLLHGYGSNETDVFSLANYIPEDWTVISARAPYTIAKDKYCWYQLEITNGKLKRVYTDAEASRKKILKFKNQIAEQYQIDPNNIVLGGFSQGAIMSFGIGLLHPDKIKGIACFSGRILREDKAQFQKNAHHDALKVFISHGEEDEMLPVSDAYESQQFLEEVGINPVIQIDKSGHTISGAHITSFLKWLNAL